MKTPKVGDIIELDCGYNGMIDMQPCKILQEPFFVKHLFNNGSDLCANVRQLGSGETFSATLETLAPHGTKSSN